MTLYIDNETEQFATNNVAINDAEPIQFILTSQYSKLDTIIPAVITISNDRYTELQLTFPTDFKDQHKNGVYYYTIKNSLYTWEKGLVKIITNPGGDNGSIEYTSTPELENRDADVYFRPNY